MPTPEPTSSSRPDKRWEQLLQQMHDDETIVEQSVENLRATVPGYDNVPTESLEESVRRNIAMSIRTLQRGVEPRPGDISEADALAHERYAQGVPIGSVLAGFRVSLSFIFHRLLDIAPEEGIPADQVLRSSTLLWALGDAFSSRAVEVYQQKEVSRAVADSTRRSEWIRNVVTTGLAPAERTRGATLYDVPTTYPVRALVAEAPPGTEADREQRLQAWASASRTRTLTAVQGSTVVGIMAGPDVPDRHPESLAVSVGEATMLDELPRSFESASLALQAGLALGQSGIISVERLSWRLGIHSNPEVTDMLHQLHLAPLEDAGDFGEHVIEAVDAYLTHRMSIPLAARSIPVHVNTLRYRLQRFREITGADLGDLNTLIELSWVLAAQPGRKARRRPTS
ncbi:MAG: PucR family transcriptional regulator [Nesterenkonia sp.]